MAAAAIEFAKGDLFIVCDRDAKARHIAEILFPLLLDECEQDSSSSKQQYNNSTTAPPSSNNGPEERIYDSAQSIYEAAFFCHGYLRNTHSKVLKSYFSRHRICEKHVFRFLKNFCSFIFRRSVNIQFAVLHSMSFVYQLVQFCRRRGKAEFRDFFPLWWEYVFNKTFKEKFYSDGGWESLVKYSKKPLDCHITQAQFRNEWKLTSETLGFDFSELELSDVDDFPNSDEESTSEDENKETSDLNPFHPT